MYTISDDYWEILWTPLNMEPTQLFANIVSTLTIASCLFLKVPQIMHVREKKSGDGIYVQAMMMEITGFTIMTLYNFVNKYSLMTYMEYPIILVQVYVLLFFVLLYKNKLGLPLVYLLTVMYITFIAVFVLGITPKEYLGYLVPFCTPLSGFAKVTYIYGIVAAGNADAVSLTTWIISVLTNVARIFTVFVDSADTKLMSNFAISTALSCGVLFTAMFYQFNKDQPCCQRRKMSDAAAARAAKRGGKNNKNSADKASTIKREHQD